MNRVLTDIDRAFYSETVARMHHYWPEMFSRKIPDSLVQFAFCYQTALELSKDKGKRFILSAGSHEDIATECLKLDGFSIVGIDPVWNCDLHTFAIRVPENVRFDFVISASVLEHTINDEEFIADSCKLLSPGGYGIFTVDFKDDWRPGQPVPYTSNRFYTTHDLTARLPMILDDYNCSLVGSVNYNMKDRFVWDGINYSFATWVFQKGAE